jgi:hypothetical protein
LKTDLFDAIYFLCADRIAREVVYQNIIIAEIVKYRKQMIIGGNDYVNKIIERTTRGKLHRLRLGQLVGSGHLNSRRLTIFSCKSNVADFFTNSVRDSNIDLASEKPIIIIDASATPRISLLRSKMHPEAERKTVHPPFGC